MSESYIYAAGGWCTPGGNPTCELCGVWYGIGEKHECRGTEGADMDVEDLQMMAAALQHLDQIAAEKGIVFSGEMIFNGLDLSADIDWDREQKKHYVKYVNMP